MKQGHRVLPRSLRASGDPIQAGVLPGQQDTPTVQALVWADMGGRTALPLSTHSPRGGGPKERPPARTNERRHVL